MLSEGLIMSLYQFYCINTLKLEMYSSQTLFKNKVLPSRGMSQTINEKFLDRRTSNPMNKLHQHNFMRIKKRAMTLKQLKQVRKMQEIEEEQTLKNYQNRKEVQLLKQIIKKKETLLQQQKEHEINRKWSQDYNYYDTIVRDLLTEIKIKKGQAKDSSKDPIINQKNNFIRSQSPQKQHSFHPSPKEQKQFRKPSFISRQQHHQHNHATIKLQAKRDSFIFRVNDSTSDMVYEKKITSYVQFLYKINFSNSIYVDLSLSSPKLTYKVKIGKGNNCYLIRSLMKRRFWIEITSSMTDCSFSWTQNTQKGQHEKQEIMQRVTTANSPPTKAKRVMNNCDPQLTAKIMSSEDITSAHDHFANSKNGLQTCYPKISVDVVSNHLPGNCIIGSKKILFILMFWYYKQIKSIDPFKFIPKTYHVVSGDLSQKSYKQFMAAETKKHEVWIIKPGENTNRGNGISVASLSEINQTIRKKAYHRSGEVKTYIIQEYLKPFLYCGRKFDIRHFLLITSVNGCIKAYWFKQGYIRTSSEKYDIQDLDNDIIHLTNDAIQKRSSLYGKYQPGNKISYSAFQRYLDTTYPHKKFNFQSQIVQQMKSITVDVMKASFSFLDPERKKHNFELYGMDFMIDSKFKPYLIEINANPCLEMSCPLLERIVPLVTEHSLRIAFDPLFPPPEHFPASKRHHLSDRMLEKISFELIFDEKYDGDSIRRQIQNSQLPSQLEKTASLEPDQEIYDDDGSELKNEQLTFD